MGKKKEIEEVTQTRFLQELGKWGCVAFGNKEVVGAQSVDVNCNNKTALHTTLKCGELSKWAQNLFGEAYPWAQQAARMETFSQHPVMGNLIQLLVMQKKEVEEAKRSK